MVDDTSGEAEPLSSFQGAGFGLHERLALYIPFIAKAR